MPPTASAATTSPDAAPPEVFLTPRVIDRAAYESYAAELRDLISQVAAQSAALRSSMADSAAIQEKARDFSGRHAESLELAGKLFKSMNQRVADAEAVLSRVPDPNAVAQAMESRALAITQACVAAIEQKMTQCQTALHASIIEAQRRAEEQIAQHEARAAVAVQAVERARHTALEDVRTTLQPAIESLHRQCELAKGLDGAGEIAQRALDAVRRAEGAAENLSGIRERSEEAVHRLSQSLDGAIDFSDRLLQQKELAERDARAVIEKCEAARKLVAERWSKAAQVVEPLIEAQERAQEAGDRAARLLEQVLAARQGAQTLVTELRETAGRLDWAVDALEPWRGVLLDQDPSAPLPPVIADLVEQCRAEISLDLGKMAAAMNLIAQRAAAVAASATARAGVPARALAPEAGPDIVVRHAEGKEPPLRLSEG